MGALLAGLPLIGVAAVLLLRQSALRAAVVGVGLAVAVGTGWFGLTIDVAAAAAFRWWPLVVEVLLIVAGGIAFAEVGRRTGAQERISAWLRRCLGTGIAPVLAIVHGVTPLAESLTGFGIGAVLAVPLLLALGLDARRSATIGLLGLCAVPWGSMGPGTLIAAQLSGVGFDELGIASAVVSLPVFVGVGIASALSAAGREHRLAAVLAATGSGIVLWSGILLANLVFGTAPAGALGALLALFVHLVVGRVRGTKPDWPTDVRRAAAAYFVLLGGVMATGMAIRMTGTGETAWRYLASPAMWLLIATIFAARLRPGSLGAAREHILSLWLHVGPALALFVALGVIMSTSGMSAHLAGQLAALGKGYLFAVPFIAAVGGFVTGSNSGANAMFAAPQAATVTAIGANLLPAMAVHNVSAALLIMAAPARVELIARLCPEPPSRGSIQRTLFGVDAAIITLLGATLLLLHTS